MRNRRTLITIHPIRLFHKPIPRRRLHERHLYLSTYLAKFDDMFILKVIILKYDFKNSPTPSDDFIDLSDLIGNVIPVATQRLADIYHHVDFCTPGFDGGGSFEDFYLCGAVPVWESDDGTDEDAGAREFSLGEGDMVWFDAGRGDVVVPCDF
ncbi:hypothetical protein AA313_de0205679 [Arthrobotrys entomopaga]|nr:hypothetical protein AA313_de0205679 [Arthrobotrys entomopaga]